MPTMHGLATFALVVMHAALAAVLLAMGVPQLARIGAELATDYVPAGYGGVVALVATALGLAVGTGIGLMTWSRGSRRWLLIVDATTTMAAWTVLPLFVMANDLPLVTAVLAPACLTLAVTIGWYDRRRRKAA